MRIAWMDDDRRFQDFNISGSAIVGSVSHRQLCTHVVEATQGWIGSASQIADVMYWTLRQASYEAYLRVYPAVSATYVDWFYSKLRFFLRVLLDSDPGVPYQDRPPKGMFSIPDYSDAYLPFEVEALTKPHDNERVDWSDFVATVCSASDNRVDVARKWFEQQNVTVVLGKTPSTALRNKTISEALASGKTRREVCESLDRQGISTTPQMIKVGITRWVQAWEDPDFRPNIQTMISKVAKANTAVKSSAVSA